MKEPLRLVYIIGTYPSLTITFIDREIKFLRQQGVDLQILAMRSPAASTPLSQDQRELQRGVIHLLPVAWLRFIFSHIYFALLRPQRYFKALFYLLTRPHSNFKARFMTFLHFAEGVYAAHLLREGRFHELHAHFVDRAATVALVVGRLLDKPYSLSIHAGPDIFVNPVLLPEKIIEARHVATCTRYNKSHIEAVVGQNLDHKISCIHHGLDLKTFQPMPPVSNERPLILSVGQLTERKGFTHLIKGCYELKDRGYAFTCHIVGRGPQYQELETLIAQLALQDSVILCGALPHEQVIEKYRQAVMFVLPCVQSRSGNLDGIPNVLAEAMIMRVPIITSNISGIPELIDDQVNGLLIPPGDDTALVDAMSRLLDEAALREELGRNGRQSVIEKFDVERNVRRFAATLWPNWFQNE